MITALFILSLLALNSRILWVATKREEFNAADNIIAFGLYVCCIVHFFLGAS